VPTKVSSTYDIDFVPEQRADGASDHARHPQWMDVPGEGCTRLRRHKGRHEGQFTFPTRRRRPEARHRPRTTSEVPDGRSLDGTAGHLHPGGLEDDLTDAARRRRRRLPLDPAKYFEPAGAVSWDVADDRLSKPDKEDLR
jgi:hypothetical protein